MQIGKYELDKIYCGDAKQLSLDIPDSSVDIIFCDPPYLKEDVEGGIYEWLSATASRVLKPGGLCCAYMGKMYAPDILHQLSTYLDYYWFNTIYIPQGASLWSKKMWSNHRPIAIYSNGKHDASKRYWCHDAIYAKGRGDKRFHKWGQRVVEANYFLYSLTNPGDVVFDPFSGGGTVPVAATEIGVNWLAFEIDPDNVAKVEQRVAITQPPLFPGREHAEKPTQESWDFLTTQSD